MKRERNREEQLGKKRGRGNRMEGERVGRRKEKHNKYT